MGVEPHRVSISKSALLLSPCLAWAAAGAEWFDETKVDTEDLSKRDKGTLFHRIIAAGVNQERVAWGSAEDVWEWYEFARAYVEHVLLPRCETYQTEVPIAVNWVTGDVQVLTGVTDRNYPNMPGYQFGTADIVAILKTGDLYIGDWKTGGTDGAKEQLMSLACGFQKLTCELGSIDGQMQWERKRNVVISCLQVNEEGVWPHESSPTNEELDSHWDSMRFQWEDVLAGKRKEPNPGIHCTTLYCPHLGHCDAVGAVVSQMGSQEGPVSGGPLVPARALLRKVTNRPLNDHEAGESMALVSAAKRQLKYAEERMKEYIQRGGRVLAGEYEWGPGNNGFRWRKQ